MKAPKRLHKRWFDSIINEVTERSRENTHFDTLYLGGGTPSVLSIEMLTALLDTLHTLLDIDALKECTIEVNPENVTESYIEALKLLGITRVSIGIQSFNDALLKRLGRPHSVARAVEALRIIERSGLSFSLDLMFGLPDQTVADFMESLASALTFNPDHISFYGLTVEPHTRFDQEFKKGALHIPEDDYNEMYQRGVSLLESAGIERYEVSNFSKSGSEALHNRLYWNHQEYLGVGPGAHSFLGGIRSYGPRKFRDWERWIEKGTTLSEMESEEIKGNTLYNESLWLGLRQRSGVDVSLIAHADQKGLLQKWVTKGYLLEESGRAVLKGEGWIYLDEITADLMRSTGDE